MFGVPPLKVSVISDVMCPWCYIGKKRFEAAKALLPDLPVETSWLPFQLDPTLPLAGKDRQTYLNEKFGSAERASQIYEAIRQAGEQDGLAFAFDKIQKSPNTLNAHRLILWADDLGQQDAMVEALFAAYFQTGADLTNLDVLADIAGTAGMDRQAILFRLHSDEGIEEVRTAVGQAAEMGVTGVPFFIIDDRFALSGAEQPETIAAALKHADATRSLS